MARPFSFRNMIRKGTMVKKRTIAPTNALSSTTFGSDSARVNLKSLGSWWVAAKGQILRQRPGAMKNSNGMGGTTICQTDLRLQSGQMINVTINTSARAIEMNLMVTQTGRGTLGCICNRLGNGLSVAMWALPIQGRWSWKQGSTVSGYTALVTPVYGHSCHARVWSPIRNHVSDPKTSWGV